MILYLIRRHLVWMTALGVSLGCALILLIHLWHPGAPFGGALIFSCFWVFASILILLLRGERCTPFEAALPISGRQILAARLLSSTILIWFPVLPLWATIVVLGRGSDRGLLMLIIEAASIVTAAQLTVQSLRIRECAPPRWAAATAPFAVVLAFLFTVVDRISTSWVLLACALASGALLGKMWLTVPKSFQVAPLRLISADQKVRRFPARLVWLPVWRTLLTRNLVVWFVVTVGMVGLTNVGVALSVLIVVLLFTAGLSRNHWLFTLPLSRHRLFLCMIGPTLGLFLATNLLRMGWLGLEPRIVIANLAAQAATSLLGISAFELPFSAHARRASRAVLTVPALLFMILYIPWSTWASFQARTSELVAAGWLSQILPGNFSLSILAASGFLGVLYWVAFRGFGLIEITAPPLRRNFG